MKERETPCSTICQILIYLFSVSYYFMSDSCFYIIFLKTAQCLILILLENAISLENRQEFLKIHGRGKRMKIRLRNNRK